MNKTIEESKKVWKKNIDDINIIYRYQIIVSTKNQQHKSQIPTFRQICPPVLYVSVSFSSSLCYCLHILFLEFFFLYIVTEYETSSKTYIGQYQTGAQSLKLFIYKYACICSHMHGKLLYEIKKRRTQQSVEREYVEERTK